MTKYNILFDLDNTLMDYRTTNRHAISCIYDALNQDFSDEEYDRYLLFESEYWKKFEASKQEFDTHGMEKIDYVRSKIYQEYFGEDIIPLELGYELMKIYIDNLGVKNLLYEDVEDVLAYLSECYNLYIASNGPHQAQIRKLYNTHILEYFKDIITAEDAGYAKPKKEFYDYLFKVTGIIPSQTALIGDSLTSDISGAKNAGISTIWYNRNRIINNTDIIPDMVITDLKTLKKIL